MPRINRASQSERINNKFEGLFQEYRRNQNLESDEIAERMGMTPPTLRSRRKNVKEFRVGELQELARITGMPIKVVIAAVFGINLDA